VGSVLKTEQIVPSPAPARDANLLDRVRAGDEQAMAQLYDRHSAVVYSAALRVLGDGAAAEDVLQEVFVQLWRNPGTFDANRGSMAAWLAVIARHRAIDQRRKRRPETDFEEVVLSVDPDLDGMAERAEALDQIRRVLVTLPEDQRSALEMAFFQGLTHTEIAAQTGEPLGTIKTRIRTALITIRKALGR
jgi:RNA polymerase sigma-70 factor (ECF subfamily)